MKCLRKHTCRDAHPATAPQRIRDGCTASMPTARQCASGLFSYLGWSFVCPLPISFPRASSCGLLERHFELACFRKARLFEAAFSSPTHPSQGFVCSRKAVPPRRDPSLEGFSAPPPEGLVRRLRRAQPGTRRCGIFLPCQALDARRSSLDFVTRSFASTWLFSSW